MNRRRRLPFVCPLWAELWHEFGLWLYLPRKARKGRPAFGRDYPNDNCRMC